MTKFGADPTELSCRRVQIGTANRPDGTSHPIFRFEPFYPAVYRDLIRVVNSQADSAS